MGEVKVCYIPNCYGERAARGLCRQHYQDQKRLGKHDFYSRIYDLDVLYRSGGMSYSQYKGRVEKMARSIPVEPRVWRGFVDRMLTEYRKTIPPQRYGGSTG